MEYSEVLKILLTHGNLTCDNWDAFKFLEYVSKLPDGEYDFEVKVNFPGRGKTKIILK